VYRENPHAYRLRIATIVNLASRHKCKLIMFPAYTFFCESTADLSHYKRTVKEVKWAASGVLFARRSPESAILIRRGGRALRFGQKKVAPASLGERSAFFAISSTVSELKRLLADRRRKDQAGLVVDLGHHQYSGRYMMTLKSVQKSLSTAFAGHSAVLLSFWRFRGGRTASDWAVCRPKLRHTRLELRSGAYNDFVDVFDV
jgi:hypothetical protein